LIKITEKYNSSAGFIHIYGKTIHVSGSESMDGFWICSALKHGQLIKIVWRFSIKILTVQHALF
jgi:hypothetical protein